MIFHGKEVILNFIKNRFFILLRSYRLYLGAWCKEYQDTIVLFCPFLIISKTNPWTSDHLWEMNPAPIFYQEAHFFGRQMENPNLTQSIPCNHRMTLHIHLWMTDRSVWLLSVYIHSRLFWFVFFTLIRKVTYFHSYKFNIKLNYFNKRIENVPIFSHSIYHKKTNIDLSNVPFRFWLLLQRLQFVYL